MNRQEELVSLRKHYQKMLSKVKSEIATLNELKSTEERLTETIEEIDQELEGL